MATLKSIVQEFCRRTGVAVPSVVATATDESVLQYMGLLNEVIEDVTSRGESWPRLQKEAHIVSTGTVGGDQGAIATLFPSGFEYIIEDTAYDRTLRRKLFGPKSAQAWQQSLAVPFTGPFYAYRLWQGHFYIQPDLAAGHDLYLEYGSNYSVLAADGVTWKRYFDTDTDTFALDEALLYKGLRWVWKKEKGLPYSQDFDAYEKFLAQAMGTAGNKGEVSMDPTSENPIRPGIWVGSGSWPLP